MAAEVSRAAGRALGAKSIKKKKKKKKKVFNLVVVGQTYGINAAMDCRIARAKSGRREGGEEESRFASVDPLGPLLD